LPTNSSRGGRGFTNDPAQNFLGQVVFDPLNVIDFGMNVGAKFARGAALSLNEARLVGGTVGASDAFVGTMYNSWTHGMNAGQAAFAKALLGPSTRHLPQPRHEELPSHHAPTHAHGSGVRSSFEDALARARLSWSVPSAANLVEADFAAGFRRVDDMNRKPPQTPSRAQAFASDEVQRSVENSSTVSLPISGRRRPPAQWSAERIAQITSAGVDDVLSNLLARLTTTSLAWFTSRRTASRR